MRTVNSNGLLAIGADLEDEQQLKKGRVEKCFCHLCNKFQKGIFVLEMNKNGTIKTHTFTCPVHGVVDLKE